MSLVFLCSLIDHLGAMDTAIALLKQRCDIPEDEQVTLREVSRGSVSPGDLLSSVTGSKLTRKEIAALVLTDPALVWGTLGFTVLPAMLQMLAGSVFGQLSDAVSSSGAPQVSLPSTFMHLLDGTQLPSSLFPQAAMQAIDIKTSVDASSSALDLVKGIIDITTSSR